MLHYVHSNPIYNCQMLERTQVSLNRRVDVMKKMWYIYTMEYYSAIRNNEFMKFLGKWMEPTLFFIFFSNMWDVPFLHLINTILPSW